MKKTIIHALAVTALLTACSNDDVVDVRTDLSTIGFSTYVDKSTRGGTGEVTSTTLKSFYVYGYTGPQSASSYNCIFAKEEVIGSGTGDDGSWRYTNTQYWTKDNLYHFHALAPTGTEAWAWSNVDYATGKIMFNMDDAQDDIIYAYNCVEQAAADQGKVSFTFNHLLSRVNFKFTNAFSSSSVQIEVQNWNMGINAYQFGTIVVGNSCTDGKNGDVSAWTVHNNDSYSATNEPQISPFTINGFKDYLDSDNNSLNKTSGYLKINQSAVSNSVMIIPYGTNTQYTASFTVDVNASVREADGIEYQIVQYTIPCEVTLPAVTMLPGYSYTYLIGISQSSTGLIEITFDNIEVTPWGDDTDTSPTIIKPSESAGGTSASGSDTENSEKENVGNDLTESELE